MKILQKKATNMKRVKMCKTLSIDVDDELQGEWWGGGEVEKRSREKE